MKTRQDFVSNSSSCSFIVSVKKDYAIKDFARELGEACTNPKSKWHNPELADRNRMILEFCLSTYELLFLGTIQLGEKDVVTYKKDFYNTGYAKDKANEEQFECDMRKIWDDYVDNVKKAQVAGQTSPMYQYYGRDTFNDAEDEIHHLGKMTASGIIVDRDKMCYEFNRSNFEKRPGEEVEYDERQDQVKYRVKKLLKYAKKRCCIDYCSDNDYPEIFAVTRSTLLNTKNLLNAGYKLDFARWEKLDDIKRRLDKGEKIFAIKVGYSGNGYGSYYIYSEDDAKGIDGVDAEILCGEGN